jgi:hypothetical protein
VTISVNKSVKPPGTDTSEGFNPIEKFPLQQRMINPYREVNWHPDSRQLRKFGLSVIAGFPLLALIFYLVSWWQSPGPPSARPFLILAATGLAAGLLAWVAPSSARLPYLVWHAAAAAIGLIVSNAVVIFIFYGLVTPIGLLRRCFGADPLRLKRSSDRPTHWVSLPDPPAPDSYFRQF